MTSMERVMFRMLEACNLPHWRAEPYFYSPTYQDDCDALRMWMKREGIEQKFMLYGDMMVGGRLLKKDSPEQKQYWNDEDASRCPAPL